MSAQISLITITFQAEKYIERTLESIQSQGCRNEFEYLIIDGNSRDKTQEIIQNSNLKPDYFISENDQGIYDAMNKGLKKAKGKYVLFMNAGDQFASQEILKTILQEIKSDPDILYSDANFVDLKGDFIGKRSEATPHKLPQKVAWHDFKFGMLICHQAFICKRSIAPFFSLAYQLSSDIDWEINCLKQAKDIKYMPEPICNYLMGGASVKNLKKSWIERFQVLTLHFGIKNTLINHLTIVMRGLEFAFKKGKKYW
jgi:glycosyltransferase involved in cell wall biosynthesis